MGSLPAPTLQSSTSTYVESDAPLAVAATPTPEEAQQAAEIRRQNEAIAVNYGHMRVLQPSATDSSQTMAGVSNTIPADYAQGSSNQAFGTSMPTQPVTRTPDPAILELANNDDLDIATIARQANKQIKQSPDEVEIRLH